MNIALIGGIYGQSKEYRDQFRMTPETTLEAGLRAAGHDVDAYGHDAAVPYGNYEIVHVHHLGRGALRAAVDPSGAGLVFSVHAFPQGQERRGDGIDVMPRSHRLATAFVLSRVDALISLSSAEQRYETARYNTQGAICRVIPNGIPTNHFRRQRVERLCNTQPWRLLYVGQLIRNKRVDVLLRALSQLSVPFRLKLAYHSGTLEMALKQLAVDLRIEDKVEFLGGRSAQHLASLYNDTDLFTFPSAFEAFPSVLTEAMLCGTPIVATRVGGIPEQIGTYGVTIPPNDVDAMRTALEEVLGNYGRFYEQSVAMSEYAAHEFSVQTMVDRHLQLYSEVLDARGTRRRNQTWSGPMNGPLRVAMRRWKRRTAVVSP